MGTKHKKYLTSTKSIIETFLKNMITDSDPNDWYANDTPRMLVSLPIPGAAQVSLKETYDSLTFDSESTKPSQGELETAVFATLMRMGMLAYITSNLAQDLKDSKIEIPKFSL